MERWKRLNLYQKILLLAMVVLPLAFFFVYARTIGRVGFSYHGRIFVPVRQGEDTVYSGRLDGQDARFTLRGDGTVEFQCGSRSFGPYTAVEDPDALPEDAPLLEGITGVVLYEGDQILFRGGVAAQGGVCLLYSADDSWNDGFIQYRSGSSWYDAAGNPVDPVQPSPSAILLLMNGPPLTHKGSWLPWLCAVGLCVLNALAILFADELFRWGLQFQIRNPERAEPSDWEIASRYLGWTFVTLGVLALLVAGLQ